MTSGKRAAIQAISGLGGIGKTALSTAYAYEYKDDYDHVLFCLADSITNLNSGFKLIAQGLSLPQATSEDFAVIVGAVKDWLNTNPRYLLIIDNADFYTKTFTAHDLTAFLPLAPKGHIIITTRAQVPHVKLGIRTEQILSLEMMSPKDSEQFMMERRYGDGESLITDETQAVKDLSVELGYLPLALEQAAAYVAAKQSSYIIYLALFRKRSTKQLAKQEPQTGDYPNSITATWQLSFDAIEVESPAVTDLMILCAFFAADTIPFEFITASVMCSNLPNLNKFFADVTNGEEEELLDFYDNLLEPLTRYSLVIKSRETHQFSVHRLVQAVILDGLSQDLAIDWLHKAVQIVDLTMPQPEFQNWTRCARIVSHAQRLTEWIEKIGLNNKIASDLIRKTAQYLSQRGQYTIAEPLFKKSLQMGRIRSPPGHADVLGAFNNLAANQVELGRYDVAESLLHESLMSDGNVLVEEDYNTAVNLNNAAYLCMLQGRFDDSERLYANALQICRDKLSDQYSFLALVLNNYGLLCRELVQYDKAEILHKEALAINRKILPANDPSLALSISNIATLYESRQQYEEAETLYDEALHIVRSSLQPEHPDIAHVLRNIADLYESQGRHEEAEKLYYESLNINRISLPDQHPDIGLCFNNIGVLYMSWKKYKKAESFFKKALQIRRTSLRSGHPDIAQTLNNMGMSYFEQKHYNKAAPLLNEALEIYRDSYSRAHPKIANILRNLAILYSNQHMYDESILFFTEAVKIYEASLGADDIMTTHTINELYYVLSSRAHTSNTELFPGVALPSNTLLANIVSARVKIKF